MNKSDHEAWLMLGTLNGWLGDFNGATSCFRRVTELAPNDFQAHYNLGLALQQQGKFAEAVHSYRRAIALNPASIEAHGNLAMTLHRLGAGTLPEAEATYRAALQINSHVPQLHLGLASVLIAQERVTEAIECAQEALNLAPSLAEAWYQIGLAYTALGKFNEAEDAYHKTLGLNRNIADAYLGLANIYYDRGRHDEAAVHLQNAIRIKPDSSDAFLKLGNIHLLRGKPQEALICYQHVITLRPDDADAYYNSGLSHELIGKHDEAIEAYKKALSLKPGHEDAAAGIAHELEKLQRFDEALEILDPFVKNGMQSARLAATYADICRHFGRRQEAIQALEHFLKTDNGNRDNHYLVHLNLGKLYDHIGEYDKAFQQFREANKNKIYPYNITKQIHFVDGCIEAFSKGTSSKLAHATNSSEVPVFIVGMPRSGTSLAEQILASHPRVFGAGELGNIQAIADDLSINVCKNITAGYFKALPLINQEMLDEYAKQYLKKLSELSEDASRITDKMPHNFQYLGLIGLLFPKARIIHCRRDPRDTCLSIYFQHFNVAHAYASDLKSLGRHYCEYQRLMRHWKQVLQVPILEIVYEELINDPERMIRHMVEFCELPWDDRCLRFYETKRVVNTPSYDQVRQPMYRKSVERWRNYEKHIGDLIEALGPDVAG